MKKLAIIMVSIMLLAPISEVLAGGAGWHASQSRMRKAYQRFLKQESQFWKKFDAEMAQTERELDGAPSVSATKGTKPCQPK